MDGRKLVERFFSREALVARYERVRAYLEQNYSDEILKAKVSRVRRRVEESLSRNAFFSRYVAAPEPEPVEKIDIAADRFRMADGEYRLEAHLPLDGPARIGARRTGIDLLDGLLSKSVNTLDGHWVGPEDPIIADMCKLDPAQRGRALANGSWLRAIIDHTVRYNPRDRWEEMLGLDEERAARMRVDLARMVTIVGDRPFTLDDQDSLMILMGIAAERDGVSADLDPYLNVLGAALDQVLDDLPAEHGDDALQWLISRMEKGSQPGAWHVDNLRKLLAALGLPEDGNLLIGLAARARRDAEAFIESLAAGPVEPLGDFVRAFLTPPGLTQTQASKVMTGVLQGTAKHRGQVLVEIIRIRQTIADQRWHSDDPHDRPGITQPAYHLNLGPLAGALETLYGRLIGKTVDLTDDQAVAFLESDLPYDHPERGDLRLFKFLDRILDGEAHPGAREAACRLSERLAARLETVGDDERPLLEGFLDHLNEQLDLDPETGEGLPKAPVKAAHELVLEFRHLEEFTTVGRDAVNELLAFTRTNLITAAVEYHQYPPTVIGGNGEDPATTDLPLDYGGNTPVIANAVRGAHALVNLAAAGGLATSGGQTVIGPLAKVCRNHPVREIRTHVGAWMDRIDLYDALPEALRTCWIELELRAEAVQDQDKPSAAWLKQIGKRCARHDTAVLAGHLIGLLGTIWAERSPFIGSRIHRRRELLMDRLKGLIWMASLWQSPDLAPALVDFAAEACFRTGKENEVSNADLGNAILWHLAHLPDGAGKPHLETLASRIDHPATVKRINAMAAKIKG